MKKLALLAGLVMVGAGLAIAGSVNVPFFLDDAPVSGTLPPASGTAGFIGLHNNTNAPLEVTVVYKRATGADMTPASNTFVIGANSSISWRPVADDSTIEGAGAAVPNAATPEGVYAGSATISWTGGANDVQGRYVEFRANGGSNAYTLPAGQ